MPTKKPEDRKAKPMLFRLSHLTVARIDAAVKARLAKDKTEAIEKAVENWKI